MNQNAQITARSKESTKIEVTWRGICAKMSSQAKAETSDVLAQARAGKHKSDGKPTDATER